ncbi:hypothetical protein [Halomonas organivorans]|uniref:Uncharacterized protein n=1 Tax=Halomonas organivorans TaxID=257772 RepID=A0A7W5BZU9_9GAMM|nr:hypothetical protein [Halomonas organivorans]MBB3141253.1 hypothetical protein [Halomonas organivorans]
MNEGKVGNRTAQTFFTGGVGTLFTMLATSFAPEEFVQIGVYASVFFAPFLSAYCTKLLNSLDEPDELSKYKAGLKKDIRFCKKCLKDKRLDEGQKKKYGKNYDKAMNKLSQANTDFHEGRLKLESVVTKI